MYRETALLAYSLVMSGAVIWGIIIYRQYARTQNHKGFKDDT